MATPMLAYATQCAAMRGERQTDSTQGDGRRARAGVFNLFSCLPPFHSMVLVGVACGRVRGAASGRVGPCHGVLRAVDLFASHMK